MGYRFTRTEMEGGMKMRRKWSEAKRAAAVILGLGLLLAGAVRAEEPAYSCWRYQEDFEWLNIDAEVSGCEGGAEIGVLHGTLAPFTVEEEEGILDILCPLLYPDMARDELVMISQRDGTVYDNATWTVERLYAKADWQVEDPAYITFSDGTIYAKNQQFPPYEAVTMASTAAIDPQLFTRVMGDLPFASKAEIGETGASLLKAVGIRTEETPALTIVYSGDQALISAGEALPYREFVLSDGVDRMAPYREQVYDYGADLYILYFGQILEGIPTSVSARYFDTADYFSQVPDIQLMYNQGGLIYFRAVNLFTLVGTDDVKRIVGVEEAAQTAAGYLDGIILSEALQCSKIRLEYYALPYPDGKLGVDAKLSPMWTFYFSDASAPIVVDAVANEVMW